MAEQQFEKKHLDALYAELRDKWYTEPATNHGVPEPTEYDELVRIANLGIALFDAGRPLMKDIDPRIIALIEKHKPN